MTVKNLCRKQIFKFKKTLSWYKSFTEQFTTPKQLFWCNCIKDSVHLELCIDLLATAKKCSLLRFSELLLVRPPPFNFPGMGVPQKETLSFASIVLQIIEMHKLSHRAKVVIYGKDRISK